MEEDPKSKKRVEAPKQARHTHSIIAALEDVIALQWDIIDGLADALLVAKSKATRALEISKTARKGPYAYDPRKNRKEDDEGG